MGSPATALLGRYAEALVVGDVPVVGLCALVVAGAAALPGAREAAGRLPARARTAALAALCAAGLAWAWHLAWLCDDAFISFRYARNLVRGRGLVWNAGERVEGYTNFLWTALMAGAIRAGVHPGQAAVVLGLASFAAVVVLLARVRARLVPPTSRLAFPLAAALFAASYTAASFATSGLETMAAALAVTLALERALAGRHLAAGLAATAAILLHPDHALFLVALGVAIVGTEAAGGRRRAGLAYAAPFVALYVPYFCVRAAYYGDLLPNTFHAKAVDGWNAPQGLLYVWTAVLGGGLWGALPAATMGFWARRRTLLGVFVAVAFPLYLAYVVRIGGDFMAGRLFVTLLPPLFLLAEIGLSETLARGRPAGDAAARPSALALVAAALTGVAAIPARPIPPGRVVDGIADERTFAPLASFAPVSVGGAVYARAQYFRAVFTDRGLTPRLSDCEIGALGWETDLEIVDCHGLTDRAVARQPLEKRARPGHEKTASREYLLARGVALSRMSLFPLPFQRLATVSLADGSGYALSTWDPDIVAALAASGRARLPDPMGWLDGYLAADGGALRDPDPAALLAFLDRFYFAKNPDPERRARLAALAGR